MTYSTREIEQQALEAYAAADGRNPDSVKLMSAALNGYRKHKVCVEVAGQILAEIDHPAADQLRRDRTIVDYLVQVEGIPPNGAANIWSDWEDYEYDLLNK